MVSKPEIIHGCQQRKPKAQAALYDLYKGRLMGVCLRYCRTTAEAEDIFQDAFVKIFNQIQTLTNASSLDSWVHSIVIRTAIDHYRSVNARVDGAAMADDLDVADGELDALEQLSLAEITALIQQLPDGCRLVVNLYLIDGYEHHDIGTMLGISTGTSKSQLARGKQLLRTLLAKKGILRYGQ